MKLKESVLLLLLPAFIYFSCSNNTISGSETTNGLTVAVADRSIFGKTLPGNTVFCFSCSFNPDSNKGFADTAIADSDGTFNFGNLDSSSYNVFTYKSDSSVAIVQNINSSKSVKDTTAGFKPGLTIYGDITAKTSAIPNAKVYLLGTHFITASDLYGQYIIKNIPAGEFTIESVQSAWNSKGLFSQKISLKQDSSIYIPIKF